MSASTHPLSALSPGQPAVPASMNAAAVSAAPSLSAPPSASQQSNAASSAPPPSFASLPASTASAAPPSSAVTAPSAATTQSSSVTAPLPSSAALSSVAAHIRTGELLFSQMEKVNSELLAMTYGALVTQLIKDYKDAHTVNAELDKIGYNIGIRLVDEFLCRLSGVGLQCSNFRDTALVIAKVAFKVFLGCTAEVGRWRADGRQCVLAFKGNPLLDFVELPPHLAALNYSNVLTGCIRGACQMVQLNVTAEWLRDELKGAGESEIRLTLKEIMQDEFADDEDK